MANEQFESLIEAMPRIASAVNAFESDALREKAMDSLMAAFGLAATPPSRPPKPVPQDPNPASQVDSQEATGNGTNGGGRRGKRSGGRRSEPTLTLDKTLSARPEGKEPLKDFLTRAQPQNQNEQVLAIAYWLSKVAQVEPVTLDKLFTGFRLAEIKVPGSFSGKVSQTGSRGWLQDSRSEKVTVSVTGEERVLHDMLKRPAKASKGD